MKRLCLGFLLAFAACGGGVQPDRYNGGIDVNGLDAKFLPDPKACAGTPCYALGTAFAEHAPLAIHNFGSVLARNFPKDANGNPVIPASMVTARVYVPDPGCKAGPAYDPARDAFPQDVQFPIFDTLPLSAPSYVTVLPFVQKFELGNTGGAPCNAVKAATSVTAGHYGLTSQSLGKVAFMPVISASLAVRSYWANPRIVKQYGWYRGLLLGWLDGGEVPTDAQGNLVTMDGAILDLAPGVYSKVTDPSVLVLRYGPGNPAFSPVVRLFDFVLPQGKSPGDYTAICTSQPCADDEVDLAAAASTSGIVAFLIPDVQ